MIFALIICRLYAPNSLKNRFNPNITKVCTAQFTGLNKIIFTQLFTRRHGTKSLNISFQNVRIA